MGGILLFLFYITLGITAGAVLFAKEKSFLVKIWLGGVCGMLLLMWSHVPFSFMMGFTVSSHILGMVLSLVTVAALVLGKACFDAGRDPAAASPERRSLTDFGDADEQQETLFTVADTGQANADFARAGAQTEQTAGQTAEKTANQTAGQTTGRAAGQTGGQTAGADQTNAAAAGPAFGSFFRNAFGGASPKAPVSPRMLLARAAEPFRKFLTKFTKDDAALIIAVVPFLVLVILMLLSHTLNYDDGSFYTGQCTYGDMNMHLGFVTSIANQNMFPPAYSLMGGVEPLNYPFLCDSVSSSLLLFGTPLRWAYMVPMFGAFLLVFMGVWCLAGVILKKTGRTAVAYVLFLLDGGLGLFYFLDGTKTEPKNFTRIFTAFYETPTNLVGENVRWTNVIADMLLPQRATLFGWCCLFAVIYVLYRAVFEEKKSYFLPAGIMAGLLPMVHTHSYFAVGLIAIAWIAVSLIRDRMKTGTLLSWLAFGIPALLLSVPQLLQWTFNAVGGEHFLRFVFNWSNSEAGDSWIWFWVKNVGIAFLLIPTAFLSAEKHKRMAYTGAFLIFLVAELIVFQPNLYDNIKLFFVWYLFVAIMTADLFGKVMERLKDIRGIRFAAAILIIVMILPGSLTIAREYVSGLRNKEKNTGPAYQLYNKANTQAAFWIGENTEPTAVFLCKNNHNNAIAALTGRNIYVGAGTFLYFHGVNYRSREVFMRRMFTDAAFFESAKESAGIDYVYVGDYERGEFGSDLITDYLRANYEKVYDSQGIEIFKVR
ncbi:MAG: hypothetical protein ILO53_08630 [Clostridia bacterium]|nr:hypothetical protein [Clostridia bacterium]